jgi:aspartyl-tRNA(Asn)/glutamyl-tRNA(Gln) amidotransferase subunit B
MLATPTDPETIVSQNPDYQPTSDIASIEPIVDQVLAANPQSVIDYKAGRDKAFAYLVGAVMKLTRGKASPQVVNDLLRKKLAE